jgi:hypothetical protein
LNENPNFHILISANWVAYEAFSWLSVSELELLAGALVE